MTSKQRRRIVKGGVVAIGIGLIASVGLKGLVLGAIGYAVGFAHGSL